MLEGLTPTHRVYPCKIRSVLASLSESDKKILSEALDNPEWTNSALATALNNKGLKVSRYSVETHRGKNCSCWRI